MLKLIKAKATDKKLPVSKEVIAKSKDDLIAQLRQRLTVSKANSKLPKKLTSAKSKSK